MMACRPINPTDLLSSSGAYPGIADRIPFTQGIEGDRNHVPLFGPHPYGSGWFMYMCFVGGCHTRHATDLRPSEVMGQTPRHSVPPVLIWMWAVRTTGSAERVSDHCEPQGRSKVQSTYKCLLHAGVGTIVKSASGKFADGQRVVSAGKWNGTWQEYALADETSLVRCSDQQH